MNEVDELESRLTRALERAPEVEIPAGFAARVAAKAAVRAGVRARVVQREIAASHAGSRVAVTAVAVLLMVAIFWLARAGNALGWLECGLAVEFAGLTAWVGLRVVTGE